MEGSPTPKWNNNNENEGRRTLLRQEAYNLGNPNIGGSMIFTQNQMRQGRENGMGDTMEALRDGLWRYPALVPTMPHLGGTAPSSPQNITVNGNVLQWENTEASTSPLVKPRYFVIYRYTDLWVDINEPSNIAAIIPAVDGAIHYEWEIGAADLSYSFVVTAVNRLHDESPPGYYVD
jgi:hypothetical protein